MIHLYNCISGKKSIKAVISYQDTQGFDEIVTTSTSSIPLVDDGDANFLSVEQQLLEIL